MSKPEPLVPAHVNLRDFQFMPLEVGRLLESETWIQAAHEPFLGHALISLWCAAWHEVPAGSLPANRIVLARKAHRTPAEFEAIAERVLAGFVECSDGRLYHPVIAEKALEAWEKRRDGKARTAAATAAAAEAKRKRRESVTDSDSVRDGSVTDEKGREGKGENTPPAPLPGGASVRKRKAKPRLDAKGQADFTPGFLLFWGAYPSKVGKQAAWDSWRRDITEIGIEELAEVIVKDVTKRAAEDDGWRRGYVPNPATYLNQRRWNDDIKRAPEAPPPASKPFAAANPGGSSPRVEDTPQRRLEGAISYATHMVDVVKEWDKQKAVEYLRPYRMAVKAAEAGQ